MPREHAIQLEGIVIEVLTNGVFRVELPNGHRMVAWTGRAARSWAARLGCGMKVIVEISPYDFSSGRLIGRVE